jgi:hypothetical protein
MTKRFKGKKPADSFFERIIRLLFFALLGSESGVMRPEAFDPGRLSPSRSGSG